MKKKSDWRTRFIRLCAVVLPLIVLCFTACKDEDKEENLPFDPTKPVVITDFSPKSGGIGNNIILYGENFGNDPKKLKVIVGGKEANIISVKNNILYCVVPRMAVGFEARRVAFEANRFWRRIQHCPLHFRLYGQFHRQCPWRCNRRLPCKRT